MSDDTPVDITPDKSLVKKLGMVGYRTEQAVAELIDNSIDARVEGVVEEICIRLDFKGRRITVSDNGHGMGMDELAAAMTIAKETKGDKSLGRFGIGMKSACSALGKRFLIRTAKADSDVEYRAEYDEDKWLSDEGLSWNNFTITRKPLAERWHGTRITISEINVPLYPNQVNNFKESFGIRYGPYLQDNQVNIRINTRQCRSAEFDVVPGIRIPVEIQLEFGHRITGHLSLLKKRSVRGQYGINLFRKGRLIKAFDKFGFSPHPQNSKLIGKLNLDHVPVNFTKSAFIEESPEYRQAVERFAGSNELRKALRLSWTVDERSIPVETVFDYFGDNGRPQYLAKRVSANLSKQMLNRSKPFEIAIGKGAATVSIKSLRDEPFYQIDDMSGQTHVVINRDSKAFGLVKNPLFLVAMIASEVNLLAENPNLAGIIKSRNTLIASFLDEWSQEKDARPRNRSVPIPSIAGYGLEDSLVDLHDFLKDRYEFKFQFTSLSTLAPYLHNLLGKVVYTLHTTPGNGGYLADLLSGKFDADLVVADRPSRDQLEALLAVGSVRRIVAIQEYSSIPGSTIAGPEKSLVDLVTDMHAHGLVLADSEPAHILEHMRRGNILDMEKLGRCAKAAHRTAELKDLLEMAG